jgi:hypothetical protein
VEVETVIVDLSSLAKSRMNVRGVHSGSEWGFMKSTDCEITFVIARWCMGLPFAA